MQPGPPAPAATKPPRRRVRSESDRKKHAGWRRCPRCARSVSTNGRNFYHHMHKCDRVFFADVIARIDATRTKLPNNSPPPQPTPPPSAPLLSPTTPPRPTTRTPLSENQRAIFMQQLCFLRVYDRTVDSVFRQVESTQTGAVGPSVFEAVRIAKRRQAQAPQVVPYSPPAYSPAASSPPPRNPYTPVPLPEALASPLTPHQAPHRSVDHHHASGSGINCPAFPPMMSPYQQPQAVYQSPHMTYQQQPQQLPAISAALSAANQPSQMPGSYPPSEMQTRHNPRASTYMYSGVTPTAPGNYPVSSHGPSMQVSAAASNFPASSYAPVSSTLPSSKSTPVTAQRSMPFIDRGADKMPYMTDVQRSTQVPISVSTPTSISASISAIASVSGHIPHSGTMSSSIHPPSQVNMPQSLSGQGNMVLPGNRQVCSGPGQNSIVPGHHEATVPASEVHQPVTSRPATPRQVSAMSISSVINN